jgi:hypothetical protein
LRRSDWQYRNILIEIKAGAHGATVQADRPAL